VKDMRSGEQFESAAEGLPERLVEEKQR